MDENEQLKAAEAQRLDAQKSAPAPTTPHVAPVSAPTSARTALVGIAWQVASGGALALGGFLVWTALAKLFPQTTREVQRARGNPGGGPRRRRGVRSRA